MQINRAGILRLNSLINTSLGVRSYVWYEQVNHMYMVWNEHCFYAEQYSGEDLKFENLNFRVIHDRPRYVLCQPYMEKANLDNYLCDSGFFSVKADCKGLDTMNTLIKQLPRFTDDSGDKAPEINLYGKMKGFLKNEGMSFGKYTEDRQRVNFKVITPEGVRKYLSIPLCDNSMLISRDERPDQYIFAQGYV